MPDARGAIRHQARPMTRRPLAGRRGVASAMTRTAAAAGGHAGDAPATARPAVGRLRWLGAVAGCLALGVVAIVGLASPATGASGPAVASTLASPAPSTAAAAGSLPAAGWTAVLGTPDPLDLTLKAALVAALLYVTLRVLRRMQGGASHDGALLSVVETRAIAPKASLHLVAIGDRRLVVGLTPSGMVSLAELDAVDVPVAVPAARDRRPRARASGGAMRVAAPSSASFDAAARTLRGLLRLVP